MEVLVLADFELQGLAGVISNLESWSDRVTAAIDEAVDEAGQEAAARVQAAAPVLTGKLRASVEHSHKGWAISVISVGEGVAYVRAVEKRTRFFNSSISVVQVGLLDRIADHVVRKAF